MQLSSIILTVFSAFVLASSCSKDSEVITDVDKESGMDTLAMPIDTMPGLPISTIFIPPSSQRMTGDADAGYEYLLYGDYVGAGIPYDLFISLNPFDNDNLLGRTGDNAVLPSGFNAFDAPNGVRVVGGLTCFGCHAGVIDGNFYPGLGNNQSDFTIDNSATFTLADVAIQQLYDPDSPEYEAFLPFLRGGLAAAEFIQMPFMGVNPAFVLEKGAVRFRHPQNLTWQDEEVFSLNDPFIGSDVPPLWHVKKKNALYYTGLGRGDYSKLMMQVMLVAIQDSAQANEILSHFDDVLAWIEQLEAPEYPGEIDEDLAIQGASIFEVHCQECHGTYGEEERYPNLFVEMDRINTDAAYAMSFLSDNGFQQWFDDSWFSNQPYPAGNSPALGYVAPPLDGIWSTAPYLHNGSVPNLHTLLNSSLRPTYWRRTFQSEDFDWILVGWNFEEMNEALDKQTYDTTLEGYGNGGHNFGDALSEEERMALIEFLKTL